MLNTTATASSDAPPAILHRLTRFDNSAQGIGICVGYVLDQTVDLVKVENAIKNVTEKWRLLAGRLEWLEEEEIWAIRVPIGTLPPSHATYSFTTTTHTTPAPFTLPASLTSTTASYFAQPPASHFFTPETPVSNADYTNKPLISIHVSVFTDATCVGFSYGHGVMDGVGFGHVVKAMDAELNGREWEVPEFGKEEEGKNVVSEFLRTSEVAPAPAPLSYFVPFTKWAMRAFQFDNWFQSKYHGVESAGVYLGKEVVARIVEAAKKELREKGGEEWVSTADVLVAWFLKAAYLDEPNSWNSMEVFQAVDGRSLLPTSFSSYPHNLLLLSSLPSFRLSTLPTLPLSLLALHFRRALLLTRSLSNLQTAHSSSNFPQLPHRSPFVDSWCFSNQVKARTGEIDWTGRGDGGKGVRMMVGYPIPMNIVNNVYINTLGENVVFTGDVRTSRWEAIKEELERLNRGEKGRVV